MRKARIDPDDCLRPRKEPRELLERHAGCDLRLRQRSGDARCTRALCVTAPGQQHPHGERAADFNPALLGP